MPSLRSIVAFALVAFLTLTGSRCVVIWTSGDNDCKKDDNNNCESQDNPPTTQPASVTTGRFIDAPVQGLGYESGGVSGMTGDDGGFRYEPGQRVRFFIGDITLGEAKQGEPVITPVDLVPGATVDSPAVVNIARLLQSLDAIPGDDRITIPETLHFEALQSNPALAPSLPFLDFANEATFVNVASQIVSTLTASYPFTAVLVDGPTARASLANAVAGVESGSDP
jgi:hypothetical protein